MIKNLNIKQKELLISISQFAQKNEKNLILLDELLNKYNLHNLYIVLYYIITQCIYI